MTTLPVELIELVLESVSVRDTIPLVYALGGHLSCETKHTVIMRRYDIKQHLKQLVVEPNSLLETMMASKSLLYGQRAVEFFDPSVAVPASAWSFIVPGCEYNMALMVEYLVANGTVFTGTPRGEQCMFCESKQDPNTVCEDERSLGRLEGKLSKSGVEHTISIVCPMPQSTALEHLVTLPSSIDQCFISGFAASSLYSTPMWHKTSMRWGRIELLSLRFSDCQNTTIQKHWYNDITYTTYEHYREYHSREEGPIDPASGFDGLNSLSVSRRLGDKDSYILSTAHALENFPFRKKALQYVEQLTSFTWCEQPYLLSMAEYVPQNYVDDSELPVDVLDKLPLPKWCTLNREALIEKFCERFATLNKVGFGRLLSEWPGLGHYPC